MMAYKKQFSVLVLLLSLWSCTKEKKEDAPMPADNKAISIKASFEKSELEVKGLASESTMEALVNFTNEETTNDQESDSVFVFERISNSKPELWLSSFCPPSNCFDDKANKSEFIVGVNKKVKFSFKFEGFDEKQFSSTLGINSATQEYVFYRKGMTKEDGIKLKLNFKTE